MYAFLWKWDPMHTPSHLGLGIGPHVCMHFLWKWDPMRTPSHLGVGIGSHFNKNAYMHQQTTIQFGVRIVGRKNLNCCTPFFGVRL